MPARNAIGKVLPYAAGPKHGRRHVRRAAVLAAVLVVVVVCSALATTWVRGIVRLRRQQQLEEFRLQTAWLVEAGIERAVAQLAIDSTYPGETWHVAAADLGGRQGADVVIGVTQSSSSDDRRHVHVQADYPAGSPYRVRFTKDVEVTAHMPNP